MLYFFASRRKCQSLSGRSLYSPKILSQLGKTMHSECSIIVFIDYIIFSHLTLFPGKNKYSFLFLFFFFCFVSGSFSRPLISLYALQENNFQVKNEIPFRVSIFNSITIWCRHVTFFIYFWSRNTQVWVGMTDIHLQLQIVNEPLVGVIKMQVQ